LTNSISDIKNDPYVKLLWGKAQKKH